jgi:hypothetical protein
MDNGLPVGWRGLVHPRVPALDAPVAPRKRAVCVSGQALAFAAALAIATVNEQNKVGV